MVTRGRSLYNIRLATIGASCDPMHETQGGVGICMYTCALELGVTV
jgi:hypothetical protein